MSTAEKTEKREQGLTAGYLVVKRSSDEVIWNAFVLRYDDPFAIPALRAYADACAQEYPKLAQDLHALANHHEERQRLLREGHARVDKLEAAGGLGATAWER
jgi:hypothetical protein